MALIITDPHTQHGLVDKRRASGADRFDEVWDGDYIMSPLADMEHQKLAGRLAAALQNALGWDTSAEVHPGMNVSDNEEDWTKNYRCPDVAVLLPGTTAKNRGTHLLGGPDFLAEIISQYDRSRDKLPFYEHVGVREALFIDRDPWAIELYRLGNTGLTLAARATPDSSEILKSEVVPVSFRLISAQPRPQIEVIHNDGIQRWLV